MMVVEKVKILFKELYIFFIKNQTDTVKLLFKYL